MAAAMAGTRTGFHRRADAHARSVANFQRLQIIQAISPRPARISLAPGAKGHVRELLLSTGEDTTKRGPPMLDDRAAWFVPPGRAGAPPWPDVVDCPVMRQTQTPAAGALFMVFVLGPVAAAAQTAPTAHEAHRLHGDPAAYIAALDDPARDAWQKPHEVIEALGLKEGERVADIGAGSGYFALRFARHVAGAGRVFAVDVNQGMLTHLEGQARAAGLSNVQAILAPSDDPRLPDGSVDRVFFCNVWHHVDDQAGYLEKLKKALIPSGQIVMIDFHKRELPVGPPVSMKIARDDLVAQMESHGFRVAHEHTFLPYQYFLVFSRK
jgi:SAM-dependent methyltransferase